MIEQINTMQAPPSLQIPVLQRTRTFKSHFPQHPGHVPAPPLEAIVTKLRTLRKKNLEY